MRKDAGRCVLVVSGLIGLGSATPILNASDWTNFGGNAQRNGRADVAGPTDASLLWANGDDYSIISWQPVTLGDRVFAIREAGFPQSGGGSGDLLIAYDLNDGSELWCAEVPYAGDPNEEWIAYIGGAYGDHVYCARGGSGRTTPIYAFDAATGDIDWTSVYETIAGPQDGFVFADNGDLFVGDQDNVVRIDALDGSTVWETARSCPVSGNCGVAVGATGVYYDAPAPGGHEVRKLDALTGMELYQSPIMPGFTAQNAPFLSPDGTRVYFARTQNNAATDFLYAFDDDGVQFIQKWAVPIRWTTSHEHGIADDGSIYTFAPDDRFVRLDPADGSITAQTAPLTPIGSNLSPRTAVDAAGNVYVSNGWSGTPATDGRVWAFSADLTQTLFTLSLNRPNSGGPSLGEDGTLVVADRLGVYAYRSAGCAADITGPGGAADGNVDALDFLELIGQWGSPCGGSCSADITGPGGAADGNVDALDFLALIGQWGSPAVCR